MKCATCVFRCSLQLNSIPLVGPKNGVQQESGRRRGVANVLHSHLQNFHPLQHSPRPGTRMGNSANKPVITADPPLISCTPPNGFACAQRLTQESADPIPIPTLTKFITDALRGLGCVHASGIVHRDVKPSNLLLCNEKGQLVCKLTDFGSAVSTELLKVCT